MQGDLFLWHDNNVPAVRFYHKQGAVLGAVNEYAYYGNADCEREIQLICI